jgi:hypothetical protein
MFSNNMNQNGTTTNETNNKWLETQINSSYRAFANGDERDLPGDVLHPCHSQSDGMFQRKLAQYLDFLQVDPGANIIKENGKVQTPLILNDHIVQNDTGGHDVLECVHIPKSGRSSDYSKSSMQNTESSFYIFSSCLLCFCKLSFCSVPWLSDGFHKCGPIRVYTVGKVVPHCVLPPVDGVVASRGITFSKPGKKMGSMQDIDIVERTGQTKKTMPNWRAERTRLARARAPTGRNRRGSPGEAGICGSGWLKERTNNRS